MFSRIEVNNAEEVLLTQSRSHIMDLFEPDSIDIAVEDVRV